MARTEQTGRGGPELPQEPVGTLSSLQQLQHLRAGLDRGRRAMRIGASLAADTQAQARSEPQSGGR